MLPVDNRRISGSRGPGPCDGSFNFHSVEVWFDGLLISNSMRSHQEDPTLIAARTDSDEEAVDESTVNHAREEVRRESMYNVSVS